MQVNPLYNTYCINYPFTRDHPHPMYIVHTYVCTHIIIHVHTYMHVYIRMCMYLKPGYSVQRLCTYVHVSQALVQCTGTSYVHTYIRTYILRYVHSYYHEHAYIRTYINIEPVCTCIDENVCSKYASIMIHIYVHT